MYSVSTKKIQSFALILEQLPLWVVPALGAAGAVGRVGLPKPIATRANFWEPGGCLFRPLVQFETAPGGVGHGGVGGPTGGQMDIWSPTLTLPSQGL